MRLNENLFEDRSYGTSNTYTSEKVDSLLLNLFKQLGVDPKEASEFMGYDTIVSYITFIAKSILNESIEEYEGIQKLEEFLNNYKMYESADNEWSKKEIESALKDFTNNWTKKEGTTRTYYKNEKDYGRDILKKYYKVVEVSDGRGSDDDEMSWVISYSEPRKEGAKE